MKSAFSILASCVVLLALPWLALQGLGGKANPALSQPSLSVAELLGGEVGQGFSRPLEVRSFEFPRDHAPHSDFRTEWWYFTGNLEATREAFGYELTLFRQALLTPLERLQPRQSGWAASHAWMGHFAISDLSRQRFFHFQKLSREAVGLAGFQTSPPRVWVEQWSVEFLPEGVRLRASQEDCQLQLDLLPLKPIVLQGNRGLSQKGPEPGQSSYYYSWTRLQTRGQLSVPGKADAQVQGLSWMDREWSTRPLSQDLLGWDWFALQLDNGQELMYYQLRDRQGRSVAQSSGTWVKTDGQSQHLTSQQVQLEVTGQWSSPLDNSTYPAGWKLKVENPDLQLSIRPRMPNQEMTGMGRYWEGAVEVEGLDAEGKAVKGHGYVELVGYAESSRSR